MTATAIPDSAAAASTTPRARLLTILNASWMTQAAAVCVQLGLPELLRDGPVNAEALAQATHCDPAALLRLLRALTSLDLLADGDGAFKLTETGALLRQDANGSLAAWAMLCGTTSWFNWGRLSDCVRTGQSVRQQRGIEGFDHLAGDPAAARVFNRAMVDLTRPVGAALARAVDFSSARRIVDVGGGVGELLATILAAHPATSGVLFDLAHATQTAHEHLAAAGVGSRCEVVTGSFFDSVPAGGDIYLLKSILHDWDDERAALISRNCRSAMPAHAKLLVIERLMPQRFSCTPADQGIARSDLNMLVGPGGRERTEAEYRSMLESAGLATIRVQELADNYSVLEAAATTR